MLIQNGELNLLKTKDSSSYFSLVRDNPLALFLKEYEGYEFVKEVEKVGSSLFWKQVPLPVLDTQDFLEINPNFPKIDVDTFLPVAEFYYTYALDFKHHTEVGSMILLNQDTGKLAFVVPQQQVTCGSVNWDRLLDEERPVCLFSGEQTTLAELMANHLFVGHCHSHNTMGLSRPSSVDDSTECGSKVNPKPLSFNLLFSSYVFDQFRQVISFVATPSFGYKGERILFDQDEFSSLFTEDLLSYTIPASKPNELKFEFHVEELLGTYDRGIHRLVTERVAVKSVQVPLWGSSKLRYTSPTTPIIPKSTAEYDSQGNYLLDPTILTWIEGYLAVNEVTPEEFVIALADEFKVFDL